MMLYAHGEYKEMKINEKKTELFTAYFIIVRKDLKRNYI